MNGQGDVTIIVPTLAEARRRQSIARAIASLRAAAAVPRRVHVLAVVNGERFDAEVVAELHSLADDVVQIQQGSAPLAQLAGRRLVATDCFGFLDDDDEYLPGAIDQRLAALAADTQADVVVSNGWRRTRGQDLRAFEHLHEAAADPLRSLFDENWLASCGALFRSRTVGVEFFEAPMPYLEWTWLAWRLAKAGRRIRVLDQVQFRIHDTPDSASKSQAYSDAHLALYQRMLDDAPRSDVRGRIQRRLQNQWALRSLEQLDRGQHRAAWHSMLQVTRYPSSWRHLSLAPRIVLRLLSGRSRPQARHANLAGESHSRE